MSEPIVPLKPRDAAEQKHVMTFVKRVLRPQTEDE